MKGGMYRREKNISGGVVLFNHGLGLEGDRSVKEDVCVFLFFWIGGMRLLYVFVVGGGGVGGGVGRCM